ncbi:hypothetical protein ACJRO7_031438 [Eucalyptus globulus]|uniref:Uncharacterized protein n=1 Tax=Eucalyptus globulus TaxID=34317 RepID=A0ABD3JIR3_EUCGL
MQATREEETTAQATRREEEDSRAEAGTTAAADVSPSRRGVGQDPEEQEAENLKKPLLSGRGGEDDREGQQEREGGGGEEEGEDEEEFEFTFACADPDGSPVAADAVFENGKIRTVYPLFGRELLFAPSPARPPLRKIFVEGRGSASASSSSSEGEGNELAGVPEETYCVWRGKTVVEGEEAAPEGCRKSYSTGFSKLWRFKELARRSSSDGKDAFVFLNPKRRGKEEGKKEGGKKAAAGAATAASKGGKKGQTTTAAAAAAAAHEKHYTKARAAKEGEKRRSYLPYKQVGFFTNVSGMSRNVHPF